MSQTIAIPSAYLGQAEAFLPERVARICSRCPDKAEAEAYAKAQGMECSHGECPACHDASMLEILVYHKTNNVS